MMPNKIIIIVTRVIASESEATQALLPLYQERGNTITFHTNPAI
jgi:hypothetical protein